VVALGTLPYSEILGGPAAVTLRTISFAPGESSSWHSHPGPVINVVTRGAVTVEDGCGGEEVFTTGQAFEEGSHVHRIKNLGPEATLAYQAIIVPPGGPMIINTPNNERRCGPPRKAVISAVYPNSGPTTGDTLIRVLGRNFQPDSLVRLGGVPLSALTFKSAGELTALRLPGRRNLFPRSRAVGRHDHAAPQCFHATPAQQICARHDH
jgi:quercetin dioxygenase-like cupin family protein